MERTCIYTVSDDDDICGICTVCLLVKTVCYERTVQCWSPDVNLTWFDGQVLRQYDSVSVCQQASDDIGPIMHRRALNGYGIKVC